MPPDVGVVTRLYCVTDTSRRPLIGIVILATGFDRADAVASIFVAALMIRSGFQLQRRALRVLLESAPEDVVPTAVRDAMVHTALVKQVHDLHVWELAPGHPILTAHVLVAPKTDCHAVRRSLERCCSNVFRSRTRPCQVEHVHDAVVRITRERDPSSAGTLR